MLQLISAMLGAILSEDLFNRIKFLFYNGRMPELRKPEEFHEKVLWLKMNQRYHLMTQSTDKYEVRQQVANAVGARYLIPLLGVYESADSIDFSELPNRFVIKPSHGSGWNIAVTDKSTANLRRIRRQAQGFLKRNYCRRSQEWQYKNIKPRLLIEEYLCGTNGELPWDYKFFCFDRGRHPEIFVQVDMGRYGDYRQILMTGDWQPAGCQFRNKVRLPDDVPPKPVQFEEMTRLARTLVGDHDFCRVDLFVIGDKVYFGELTLHPYAGFKAIRPLEASLRLGSMIQLPGVH